MAKKAGVKNPSKARPQPKPTARQKAIAAGLAKRKQHQKRK